MAITVHNYHSLIINASVNHWTDEGSTTDYTIAPGNNEIWNRSDTRGFVLYVHFENKAGSYLVSPNSIVGVYVNKVVIDGKNFPMPNRLT